MTQSEGRTFEDSTIKERYEGEVGEEYKERLAAKVEGREYVPGQRPPPEQRQQQQQQPSHPSQLSQQGRKGTGGMGMDDTAASKKERNEAYFSKLGNENASRSEALPPSQGGKFTGFGGGLPESPPSRSNSRSRASFMGGGAGGGPALDDFQKDPMGTLTKGFGWFTSTVGKSAKTVHESYIQPTAKQLAESDLAAQARVQAANLGQNLQTGARGAADHFNRFVEGSDEATASVAARRRQGQAAGGGGGVEPERKDFWDDFASVGEETSHRRTTSKPNAIGTAAMKPPGNVSAASGAGSASGSASGTASGTGTGAGSAAGSKQDEKWDDDW